jgi:hypothetical protein
VPARVRLLNELISAASDTPTLSAFFDASTDCAGRALAKARRLRDNRPAETRASTLARMGAPMELVLAVKSEEWRRVHSPALGLAWITKRPPAWVRALGRWGARAVPSAVLDTALSSWAAQAAAVALSDGGGSYAGADPQLARDLLATVSYLSRYHLARLRLPAAGLAASGAAAAEVMAARIAKSQARLAAKAAARDAAKAERERIKAEARAAKPKMRAMVPLAVNAEEQGAVMAAGPWDLSIAHVKELTGLVKTHPLLVPLAPAPLAPSLAPSAAAAVPVAAVLDDGDDAARASPSGDAGGAPAAAASASPVHRGRGHKTSTYRGVGQPSWQADRSLFQARLNVEGTTKGVGNFQGPHAAARAYDIALWATRGLGSFRSLNFAADWKTYDAVVQEWAASKPPHRRLEVHSIGSFSNSACIDEAQKLILVKPQN